MCLVACIFYLLTVIFQTVAVKVRVDDRKKIWKKQVKKLMNIENEWSDSIDASKVEGAMNQMNIGKASGPSEFPL